MLTSFLPDLLCPSMLTPSGPTWPKAAAKTVSTHLSCRHSGQAILLVTMFLLLPKPRQLAASLLRPRARVQGPSDNNRGPTPSTKHHSRTAAKLPKNLPCHHLLHLRPSTRPRNGRNTSRMRRGHSTPMSLDAHRLASQNRKPHLEAIRPQSERVRESPTRSRSTHQSLQRWQMRRKRPLHEHSRRMKWTLMTLHQPDHLLHPKLHLLKNLAFIPSIPLSSARTMPRPRPNAKVTASTSAWTI